MEQNSSRIDIDRIADTLRHMEPDFLPKDRSGKGYICPNPNCNSGSGPHGTGISLNKKDGTHYKCFSCGLYEDVIGLWGIYSGTENFIEQVKGAADYYRIPLAYDDIHNTQHTKQNTQSETQNTQHTTEQLPDFTSYYREAEKRLTETDYMQKRGISLETCRRFHIGYDPKWKNPILPYIPASARIIIPQSKNGYLARGLLDGNYCKQNAGKKSIFNEEALKTAQKPIFIVEGEIDAMSIIEAGGEAVGLGGKGNTNMLLKALKDNGCTQRLYVAMDNDEEGRKQREPMLEALKKEGYDADIFAPYADVYKDANEALLKDPDSLKLYVSLVNDIDPEESMREAYSEKESNAAYIQAFINGIAESVNTPCIPTGFKALDHELDGGLYEGLYMLGAETSTGKSAIALQIADQIAQQGKDILFFSLEMARTELMARSISRHTYTIVKQRGSTTKDAKTARGITAGKRYKDYSKSVKQLITDAVKAYESYANHIYIKEGFGEVGVEQIREQTAQHIEKTGRAPVVFVDYLQILAPYNPRYTDKQNVDKAVLELKRLSRDFKTPVFVVSSVNRAGYHKKVEREAFKESGGIEYSVDVLLGFYLQGAKTKDLREMAISVLKNRNGNDDGVISVDYRPMFNYFEEV